ncbi:HAD family hydrolase [Micromonospora chalcea]|uniref:Haloacid dehalogenase n=1 Tax=Micromonospora chalcea TaxID=1874 RepID=A0ABX9YCS0_MICCH|nr:MULTISPECIES: haloacid dehalogenase-like hydrolase [Micromonospora]MBP1780499.1 phosphoglycolate phosphatase [Micromonospora sp. HB375]MCT2278826.1 haloacid dehalogenase-like hydrolase [Micromonospora chalcea]MDH6468723.1 phosphoglycolate phosphatase [Micromonospora sp. H404/HB375]ODB79667.1 haloacid dehalogenase [Micromonospora sp. II]RQW96733.1 haloacid dehalogenase [Micromonospora chalcea]
MPPLMVGFDLDMTLVDSRPGIAAAFRALTARTGVHVDGDLAVSRLGPPLRTELAHWFPPERIEEAVTLYRELYPAYAITPTVPMPGAEAALRAVQARGGRTMVVTAKIGRLAKLHLDHLGLPVDELAGDVFAEQKAVALREHGATLYVGDHVADMAAARAAGIPGVAVATGPCSADELTEAGAYLVLDDLVEFPRALDRIIGLALEG